MSSPLVGQVELAGFRSARALRLAPSAVCALVGEARAGKSNVLAAIRATLDPAATAALSASDVPDGDEELRVHVTLGDGSVASIEGAPPHIVALGQDKAPDVAMLPAAARGDLVIAGPHGRGRTASRAADVFAGHLRSLVGQDRGPGTSPALSMVETVRACCIAGVRGLVLLVEEPELYLGPQSQRYFYRLLRQFAAGGNQVIYSTHSPAFLNVARLDELAFVERPDGGASQIVSPASLSPDADFRVLSEFDAERAELFLARAAVLVEGMTEKLALPFVFSALGIDADAERISIVECGGKANVPLFARVCGAARVPCIAVHDLDARPGRLPSRSEQRLNHLIADAVGPGRTVVLEPDFEGVAGLRGHNHKPRQAWVDFSHRPAERMPEPLRRAVLQATELARSPQAR